MGEGGWRTKTMKTNAWKGWRTAGIFLLLAVTMGALQWNWFAMPLERDEGEYAYAAWLMRSGKGVPYLDSFLQKPPIIIYTYGLVEALAPESDKVGFRVAGFLAALAAAGLVWGLGKREFGGRAGLWAACLWVVFLQQVTLFNSVAANVEKFMVVPMLGAMLLAGRGELRGWRWGLAGVLGGMAVLYKPICVPVLGVHFLLAARRGGGEDWKRTAGCWGRAVAGAALAMAAGVAWFAWKGALGALWECAVTYTGAYAAQENPLHNAWVWVSSLGSWKILPIAAVVVAGVAMRWRDGWRWGVVFAVAELVALGSENGHYHIMALPLAAMWGGAAVEGVGRRFGNRRVLAEGAAMALPAVLLLGTGNEYWMPRLTPRGLCAWLYNGNPFVEAEGAGKLIAEACGEDETVHIVGSEPEILWYARRKGATRFDIVYPLSLATRHAERYQKEALETLQARMPDAIVFARSGYGFCGDPEVYAGYLQAMTRLTFGGGYRLAWAHIAEQGVWVQGGRWAEREAEGASMGIWMRDGRHETRDE